MSRVRWSILTLLFFATTINYLDRIVFSVLSPVIRDEMKLSPTDYGYINGAFQIFYTAGFLLAGKLIDRYGTKIGFAVCAIAWSFAALGHTFAQGPWQLAFWRALLGVGEAGNFPAAIKATTEWFPRKDRAFATGIFNSGAPISSIVGPPLFAWMVAVFGWRACFAITAATGFVWAAVWWLFYRQPEAHPEVNRAELAYIHGDIDERETGAGSIGWVAVLAYPQTWAFIFAKFFSDPVWWFYLYWLPLYFADVRHFDLKQTGWALPVIYSASGIGSVAGGWISGLFIRRGWQALSARKAGMAIFAAMMPLAATSVLVADPLIAISLVCIATAAHQGWSANLFTTTSDLFPKNAVGSVTGIGGCAGGLGGVLFSAIIPGYVVANFGYTPVFLTMGAFHLTGLFIFLLLMKGRGRIQAR